jgi:hypothetical protein
MKQAGGLKPYSDEERERDLDGDRREAIRRAAAPNVYRTIARRLAYRQMRDARASIDRMLGESD